MTDRFAEDVATAVVEGMPADERSLDDAIALRSNGGWTGWSGRAWPIESRPYANGSPTKTSKRSTGGTDGGRTANDRRERAASSRVQRVKAHHGSAARVSSEEVLVGTNRSKQRGPLAGAVVLDPAELVSNGLVDWSGFDGE